MTTKVHLNPVPETSAWGQAIASWSRSLRARDLSPASIKAYSTAARNLASYAIHNGVATPEDCTPATVEDYVAYRFEIKPGCTYTMSIHVKSLRLFFARVCDLAEIPDPMRKIATPKPKQKPVPLYTDDALKALVASCSGKEFGDRRDLAIIRVLLDTGMRRAEIASLVLGSFNLGQQEITFVGKGNKIRTVTYGAKTADAIDRYLAVRRKHPDAGLAPFWLAAGTRRGSLNYGGMGDVIERRARQAGVDGAFLHRFRHTAADAFLSAGGSEGDAMALFGWEARVMLDRYGSAGKQRRALATQRRLSPGDRI